MELYVAPLLALLLGYGLGSIPFGLVLTRIFGGPDLRAIGSGNIGATNVLRTGRKDLAALTLLLDIGKGFAAVALARLAFDAYGHLAAVGAFLGHCHPVWLGFRGGKGVATLGGVLLGIYWVLGLAYAGVWLAVLLVTRFSSAAGIAAAALTPVIAAALGRFDLSILTLAFALLVLWKHRGNLERLIAGTEPRVGERRRG
ncbi:MAG: glycerol-3-phosphate 1-O-acyltransferase PlsY [Sphingomonadaceae bacterium]